MSTPQWFRNRHLIVDSHLIAADRALVSRIEGQNHRSSCQIAERQILVRRHPKFEVWSCRARRKNARHLLVSLRSLRPTRNRKVGRRYQTTLWFAGDQPPSIWILDQATYCLDGGQDSLFFCRLAGRQRAPSSAFISRLKSGVRDPITQSYCRSGADLIL